MIAGETRDNFELWEAGKLSFEELIRKVKEQACAKSWIRTPRKGSQALPWVPTLVTKMLGRRNSSEARLAQGGDPRDGPIRQRFILRKHSTPIIHEGQVYLAG